MRRGILAGLAVAITLSTLVNFTTDAQSDRTTDVDVRVWQRIADAADLAISVRPEGRAWADLGTVSLDLRGLSDSERYRYADTTTEGVEVRVWQGVSNLRSLYISARPVGGSWEDLGTIPLEMGGRSDSGRWRYGDITVAVPVPSPQEATEDPGAVLVVSVGEFHTCALWESGRLACWGENDYGQIEVPEGRYRSVSVGIGYTCAVRDSGRILCWGNPSWSVTEDVPEGWYRSVSSTVWHACAIRESGTVRCWGSNEDGQAEQQRSRAGHHGARVGLAISQHDEPPDLEPETARCGRFQMIRRGSPSGGGGAPADGAENGRTMRFPAVFLAPSRLRSSKAPAKGFTRRRSTLSSSRDSAAPRAHMASTRRPVCKR